MKKKYLVIAIFLFVTSSMFSSCKKDKDPVNNTSATKNGWVTGSWKQADLVMAVSAKLGGQTLPAGFSVYNLAGMLPVTGPKILASKDNVYNFAKEGSYTITGSSELVLPNAGNAGTWKLEVYDAVLRLTSGDNETAPNWINSLDGSKWSLAVSIFIPEINTNVPLNLLLEKQ